MNMGDVRTSLSGIRLSPFLRVAVVTVSTRGPTVLRGFASEERQHEAAAGWC